MLVIFVPILEGSSAFERVQTPCQSSDVRCAVNSVPKTCVYPCFLSCANI